jgi:hypothetical protein
MATCNVPPAITTTTLDIEQLLHVYVQNAEDLITQCQQVDLKDAKKLEKKCRSELKYLLSVSTPFFLF